MNFFKDVPQKEKITKQRLKAGYGNKHKSFLRRYNIKEDNVKA